MAVSSYCNYIRTFI